MGGLPIDSVPWGAVRFSVDVNVPGIEGGCLLLFPL
jgi:hypothetical protein